MGCIAIGDGPSTFAFAWAFGVNGSVNRGGGELGTSVWLPGMRLGEMTFFGADFTGMISFGAAFVGKTTMGTAIRLSVWRECTGPILYKEVC